MTIQSSAMSVLLMGVLDNSLTSLSVTLLIKSYREVIYSHLTTMLSLNSQLHKTPF